MKDICAVLERQISTTYGENMFEESIDFSRVSKKIFVAFGCDRGGNSTTMLLRVLNRKLGNAARFSQPICQYEDGSECYENLAATVYDGERYPVKAILQGLVDDAYHAISVIIKSTDGHVLDARTELVHLTNPELVDYERQFQIVQCLGPHIIDVNLPAWVQRIKRSTVTLLQLQEQDNNVVLSAQVIANNDGHLVGFVIFEHNIEVLRLPFYAPIKSLPLGCTVNFRWDQVLAFPSQDTKMSVIVSGQGTCSVLCPCLVCDMKKSDFEFPPVYFSLLDPETFPAAECKDGQLRTGTHSNQSKHQEWCDLTNHSQYRISKSKEMEYKDGCNSVTHKPLLHIPVRKESAAPMHAMQGICSHFFNEIREATRKIDVSGHSDWLDGRVAIVEAEMNNEHAKIVQNANRGEVLKQIRRHQRKIDAYRKKIEGEGAAEEPDLEVIVKLTEDVEVEKAAKQLLLADGYGKNSLLLAGTFVANLTTKQSIPHYNLTLLARCAAGMLSLEESILEYKKPTSKKARGKQNLPSIRPFLYSVVSITDRSTQGTSLLIETT